MLDSLEIEKLSYRNLKDLLNQGFKRLIIPVGTIEAHGPHLPLSTDVIIPKEIAKRVAPELKALIAPPIYYGITKSLLDFEGGTTITETTLETTLREIILGFKRHGFETFIVFNGHGGNKNAIKNALRSLWLEHGVRSISLDWWIFGAKITEKIFGEAGAHGGVDETAVILATHPELVDIDVDFNEEVALYEDGIDTYPFYGTIIIYKEGEGLPKFNKKLAEEYLDALTKFLIERLKIIVERVERLKF